jgi:hypothetical protein
MLLQLGSGLVNMVEEIQFEYLIICIMISSYLREVGDVIAYRSAQQVPKFRLHDEYGRYP